MDSEVISQLRSHDPRLVVAAIKKAIITEEEGYLPYIVAALYHLDPEVRQMAAIALRRFRDPRVADIAMFALVTEEEVNVLFELVIVFLYHPRSEAVEVLQPFLLHDDYRLRSAAVEVLGAISSMYDQPELINPIMLMLEDGRPSVIMVTLRSLAHAVESLRSSEKVAKILEKIAPLAESDNKMVRDLAVRVHQQMTSFYQMLLKSEEKKGE